MSFWKYTNPNKFMTISGTLLPGFSILTVLLISIGLIWGFFFTPDDFRMGSTVKIIYLHVPSALIAINTWFVMLIGSLIWLVRRHHVSTYLEISRPYRSNNDNSCPGYRCDMGTTYVGNFLGLGSTSNLIFNIIFFLPWIHRIMAVSR